MIYTEMTKLAMRVCFDAHKEQQDKSEIPYVFHPYHLAEQMQDEDTATVALLHDVVEDSDFTLEDLKSMGFPERVLNAVELMTHDDSVPYMDYILEIKKNKLATVVKLADLKHNSDPTRLSTLSERDLARMEKYKKAMSILTE